MASSRISVPTFNGTTVLVTGGAGFIGSAFIRALFERYPKAKVVCLDLLTYAGNKENLRTVLKESDLIFVKGDVTDPATVSRIFTTHMPDYVIHFAAESHVDRSIHDGASAFVQTNVVGTATLLQAVAAQPSVKRYVQVSTDEVYGALSLSSKCLFKESDSLAPNSPYAASKAAADLLVRSFFVTYGTPVVITRCSNNYGPYQFPEKLIPFSIMRLRAGEPITLYGDGKYVRDWIHVDDHVSALMLALLKGVPGETYNIGASEEVSNRSLAERLCALLGKDASSIVYVTDRPGHDRRYAIDSTKAMRELGWKPHHRFEKGIAETVAWYEAHGGWAKRALKAKAAPNGHIGSVNV